MKDSSPVFLNHMKGSVSLGVFFKIILLLCLGRYGDLNAVEITVPPVKSVTDIHCHIAGLGYGNTDCFISEKLQKNYNFFLTEENRNE